MRGKREGGRIVTCDRREILSSHTRETKEEEIRWQEGERAIREIERDRSQDRERKQSREIKFEKVKKEMKERSGGSREEEGRK